MLRKFSYIVIFVVLLLALGSLYSCGARKFDYTVNIDRILLADKIVVRIYNEDGDIEPTSISNGEYEYIDIKAGDYSLEINRYGQVETISITVGRKETEYNARLFGTVQGSSSEGAHYNIDSIEQLMNLRKMTEVEEVISYHITGNLDFSGIEFNPIPNFTGALIGKPYNTTSENVAIIRNINISKADTDDVALFAENNGTISNININSSNITGKERVGVLVGSNFGAVRNIGLTTSTVTGDNFVGGIVGYDEGEISNCTASVTLNCSEFFGNIAGISFNNPLLGAYGFGTSLAGVTPITSSMSATEKYLTAIDNWYALDNRAVLNIGETKIDITETMNNAINQVYGEFGGLTAPYYFIQAILQLIRSQNLDFSIREKVFVKRIYNGDYEEGLNEVYVVGNAFTQETSFDSVITPLITIMSGVSSDIEMPDINFPMGFIVYYNETDDTPSDDFNSSEMIEMQISDDAYVSNGNVYSEFGNELYYVNIPEDLDYLVTEDEISEDFSTKVYNDYIIPMKDELTNLTMLDLETQGAVVSTLEDTLIDGVYNISLEVDPSIAFKYIFDEVQAKMDIELLGTIGEGTTIDVNYDSNIILDIMIWENGNLKSVSLRGEDSALGATIIINLTEATREKIRQEVASIDLDGNGSLTNDVDDFDLEEVKFELTIEMLEKYSYSKGDTSIDVYRQDQESMERLRLVEEMLKEEEPEES